MNLIAFLIKLFGYKRKDKLRPNEDLISRPDKVAVNAKDLTIGMYVTELDRPWLETSFKFQGFEITGDKELQEIRRVCDFVYVDVTRQVAKKDTAKADSQTVGFSEIALQRPPPRKISSIDQEIDRADNLYKEAGDLVKEFMEKTANGQVIDVKVAKEVVAECVNSILHSPDATLWLSQLKNKDEYTSQHSLNVCALSIILGRHINLSVKQLNEVGLCGMMHDMGKMLVPNEILNKPGKLDQEELIVMQNHTSLGFELLKSSPNMYLGAIETAYTHHERLDGRGYPRGVAGNMIGNYTRIVTIADMYDAMTSDRVYKKGMNHLEAINIMSQDKGHLDPNLVTKFIESIGVYPPGTMVELNSGEIAIVVEVNNLSKLRPKIILLTDRGKHKIPEKTLDLNEMRLNADNQVFTIKRTIRPSDYGIDGTEYYQRGFLQKGFSSD